jgi:glycosyltransferase involved in cell wall biosynthesis
MIKDEKVIWVINFFAGNPESGWGERHYYFAKYWKESGFKVKIISSSFNHLSNKLPVVSGSLFTEENYNGIDFIWVKSPVYNPKSFTRFVSMLVFAWNVLRLPIEKFGKPSTVIVSSMPVFPIWSGLRMKRKWNCRLLFEIRDIWPLTLQLLGNKSNFHPAVIFLGWFEKIGYRNSDVVVSLLPNAQKHFNKIAKKEVPFSYIPNGIDYTQLDSEKIPQELESKIPKGKFIIGYAGTIGLANALEFFVGAAELLKDDPRFHFVIVGDGYLKADLERQTSGWSNITFFEKIRKNQVQNLLTFFDVCFVGRNNTPLFQFGVSANKYFDYMLAEKPILDSNNLIKDPVELSGCGIIVSPDSSESIRDGIEEFFSLTTEERNRMGSLGKAYVLKEHNIEILAKRYSELF